MVPWLSSDSLVAQSSISRRAASTRTIGAKPIQSARSIRPFRAPLPASAVSAVSGSSLVSSAGCPATSSDVPIGRSPFHNNPTHQSGGQRAPETQNAAPTPRSAIGRKRRLTQTDRVGRIDYIDRIHEPHYRANRATRPSCAAPIIEHSFYIFQGGRNE